MSAETGRLSFAKAAASAMKKDTAKNRSSAPTDAAPKTLAPASPAITLPVAPKIDAAASQNAPLVTESSLSDAVSLSQLHPEVEKSPGSPCFSPGPTIAPDIVDGLDALKEGSGTEIAPPDSDAPSVAKASSSMGPTPPSSEEVSQKADSNSELGTKPPSLDGKSITSGTTFNALDEKESLRPDDSASVKASADEDDSFSIRGSLLINSRLGSDLAARAQRIQLGDMPLRVLPNTGLQRTASGVITPASDSLEQQQVTEASVQLATGTSAPSALSLNGQNPDDKLLEAMQTPKDRLFLLRLENDVVNFVQNSKEPFMDLPPSNSFCRMLTHKLADYYHMTHSFEAVAGSVRIYRTPFCRVPPALATFVAASTPRTDTPPPIVQPRKIMKRSKDDDLMKSAGPSKPTSENGSDLREKVPQTKEKLSREAREEAYNKARERIFAGSVSTETSALENSDSADVSRASSVSAKDRGNQVKKSKPGKQRRDDSKSFDSRSQYVPYYNHLQQPTWIAPQYVPVENTPFPTAMPMQQAVPHSQLPPQPPPLLYPDAVQPLVVYGAPISGYSAAPQRNNAPPNVGASPLQYHPAQSIPARVPGQNSSLMYTSPGQVNMQPPAFSHSAGYPLNQTRPGPPPPAGIPYAFGQLPVNTSPHDLKSQHPIPGSYSGHSYHHPFNPATQSFVPGASGTITVPIPMADPAGLPPYGGGGPHHLGGQSSLQGPGSYGGGGAYMQPPVFSTSSYGGSPGSSYGVCQGSENVSQDYPLRLAQPPMAPGYQQQGMPPLGSGPMARPPVVSHGGYGPAQHHAATHGPVQVHGAPRGPALHTNGHGKPNAHGQNPPHRTKRAPNAPPSGPKGTGPSSNQPYGNLPNYGNPATLPQKPTATN